MPAPHARYPGPVDAEAPLLHRLWARDPGLWDAAPDSHVETALDWLDSPHHNQACLPAIESWAARIHERLQPRRLLLVGQGGATLGAQVLARLAPEPALEFQAVESLNAAALEPLADAGLTDALIVIASKSGDTLETADLARYCESLTHADRLIAITDPDTPLHEDARKRGYPVRLNPPGIGGRYSVLSEFGLAVGALLKLPLHDLLQNARTMALACQLPAEHNPGIRLGERLYDCWRNPPGHLYLELDDPLERLGLWLEQLIAESSGKRGAGILPVRTASVPADAPVIRIRWQRESEANADPDRSLPDWAALGGEFFRWEFAMAWAGARQGINPFDQPDVAATKRHTRRLLEHPEPFEPAAVGSPPLTLAGAPAPLPADGPADLLARFLSLIPAAGYLAILAHLPERDDIRAALADLIAALTRHVAGPITLGFAPQYLHATGQLHKGGPACGGFLQLLPADEPPIAIPERHYTFADLLRAQADADWRRLEELGRPLLRANLHGDPAGSLPALTALARAIKT